MRIPVTINHNTLKTYNYCTNNKNVTNNIQSDNLIDWDKDIPKSLQEICLEGIAKNWEANPILDDIPLTIDRCFLLNILSTDLSLNLTIHKIEDDIYWKRSYLQRWPKLIPENVPLDFHVNEIVRVNKGSRRESNNTAGTGNTNSNSSQRSRKSSLREQQKLISNVRTWKECFLENHIRDYLEKLKPEEYDAEKIKELSDLGSKYLKILDLRELQCSENSPNRIPLNAIVSGLQNLTELSICFKQTYVGEKFTWDILKVTPQNIKLLAKGLERCNLKIFRLRNSDVDDEKAVIILKSLLKHEQLQCVDFSHCQISDDGGVAVSSFCLQNRVSEFILANNRIGAKGAEALAYTICKNECNLKTLDLKLNPLNNEGTTFLTIPLKMGVRNIKKLYLNGCGIKHVSSIGEMIEYNSCLEHLDLSNNSLGEDMGKIILQGLRYNTTLKKLDVRMCKLNPEHEFEILQRINKNRRALRCPKAHRKPIIIEPQYNIDISSELLSEIENAFSKVATPVDELE